MVPALYYALFKPCAQCYYFCHRLFCDNCDSKYIKTSAELNFIILLRHMVLLVEICLKDVFPFTQCWALRGWFFRRRSLWCVFVQRAVLGAFGCGTERSSLVQIRPQLPENRGWRLWCHWRHAALVPAAPAQPSLPPLSSLSGAGVWLCVLCLLPVTQAAMAKEPEGDLGSR